MNYESILDMDNITLQECEEGYKTKKRTIVVNDGHIVDFLYVKKKGDENARING